MVDEDIIDEVIDEISSDIKQCAIMKGIRSRADCEKSCDYRHICVRIFEKEEENVIVQT